MTDAEARLWRRLRMRQLAGFRFRRQHPIGPFIADFACLELGIIIELDGGQHSDSPYDQSRDAWLRAHEYCILRFWNNDVLNRTDDVVAAILNVVEAGRPHPNLPPQAGEGANS